MQSFEFTVLYFANNTKTKYEYDTQTFRLKRLLTTRNNGIDILQDISYIYDPIGNIVEMNDLAQQTHYFSNSVIEPNGQYWYDALYRITKATGRELTSLQLSTHEDFANNIAVPNAASNAMQNYTQQYSYNKLGNILQIKSVGKWTRNYFYNSNNNYLVGHSENTTEYTYDAHGNMLTMPHLSTMDWDHENMIVKTTKGTESTFYRYDASGERVRKITEKQDGSKEERLYLGGYEVYRKIVGEDIEKERTTISVNDDKKRIATVDTLTIDGGTVISNQTAIVRYQYDNYLGSSSLELDESASIISYEEYHPFGTTSYRSGRSETEVSMKKYKYVGKERDEETGLYYYGARYYASWIGRFTSVDPMVHERSWVNPYNYCQNNPINRTDPTGALDEDPPETITFGNIIFENTHARQVQRSRNEINKLKEMESTALDSEKKDICKKIKAEESLLPVRLDLANKMDSVIKNVLKASEPELTHTKDVFGFKTGGSIKPLEEVSQWASDGGLNLKIKLQFANLQTTEGETVLGSTTLTKKENNLPSEFQVNISSSAMNPESALANELGDVYFDTLLKDSEYQESDKIKIEKYVGRHKVSEQKAHDKIYSTLNASKFSFYIESLYKPILDGFLKNRK